MTTLGSLYTRSFRADLDQVRTENGSVKERLVISHPEAVVVVPVLEPDSVLVVSQYRYAVKQETIEFPAGKVDPGEDVETAARRELIEETGYQAETWQELMTFAPNVAYSTEMIHVYAATGLTRVSSDWRDIEEIDRVEMVKLARIKEMIQSGQIIDGTTILALAAYEWAGMACSDI
jgi:ADP-ribose pyrophosphatase